MVSILIEKNAWKIDHVFNQISFMLFNINFINNQNHLHSYSENSYSVECEKKDNCDTVIVLNMHKLFTCCHCYWKCTNDPYLVSRLSQCSYMEHNLHTFPEDLGSPPFFPGFFFKSLVFCVVLCILLIFV